MSKISEYFIALYWPDDKLAKALPDLSPLKDGVFELAIRSNRDKGRKILNMARCNLSQPRECLERLNQCYLVLYGLSGIRFPGEDRDANVRLWSSLTYISDEYFEREPILWSIRSLREYLERQISETNDEVALTELDRSGSPDHVAAERKRAEGRPWFLVLELFPGEEKRFRDIHDLDSFRVTIRETGTTRLVADMTDEPMEYTEHCADVLEKAQAMVREAGPDGSDFANLYLWSNEKNGVIELGHLIPDNMSVKVPDNSGAAHPSANEDYRERVVYSVDDLLTRLRNTESSSQ